ncbi:hypothetical protein D3C86_1166820 [compost metagenome]
MRAGADGFGGAVRGVADGVEDVLAGAETAIEQTARVQGVDDGGVVSQVVRLAPHGRLPIQTQPGQIFKDGGFVFRLAAGRVDVLDAQHKTPAGLARRYPGGQGREGVAPVQPAGGRGGEAGGEHRPIRSA